MKTLLFRQKTPILTTEVTSMGVGHQKGQRNHLETSLIERILLSPVALDTTDEIKKEACTKMVQASFMSLGKL